MVADIPGFYFDENTNRYYRLKPGDNIKTKNILNKKENINKKKKKKKTLNYEFIHSIIDQHEKGLRSSYSYSIHSSISLLQKKSKEQNIINQQNNQQNQQNNEFPSTSFTCFHNNSSLLLQWYNSTYSIFLQTYNMNTKQLECNNLLTKIKSGGYITNCCWGEYQNNLYKMICLSGDSSSNGRCFIYKIKDINKSLITSNTLQTKHLSTLVAYKKTLFSCNWQKKTSNICLGVSKGCLHVDASTGKMIHRYSLNYDGLKQIFSSNGIIYNGMRGGKIEIIDTRSKYKTNLILCQSKPRFCSKKFYYSVNPNRLYMLNNENNLYSSYTDGSLLLWDIRKDNVIYKYDNSCKDFCIDSNEEFLFSINNEKELSTWNILSNNLINYSNINISYVPYSIYYTDKWKILYENDLYCKLSELYHYHPAICSYSQNSEIPFNIHSLYE